MRATVELLSLLATLAGLLAVAYRLGVWHEEMHNTKHNVGAEIARYHAASTEGFARLERRFATFDDFIAAATEQRVSAERWQARADTTLTALDVRVVRLERVAA